MGSITWMYSEKHGLNPCSDPLEVEQHKKAGWVEVESPAAIIKKKPKAPAEPIEHETDKESSDQGENLDEYQSLIALAEEKGVFIDKRWGILRIRKALKL